MPSEREREPGLEIALERAGGVNALARVLQLTSQTVAEWTRIPQAHVLRIEALYKISREELRPDVYLASRPLMSPAPPLRRRGRPRRQ
jgi:DNA-binding transcriptional regulator YdaS (Cro superfamily)